MLLPFSAHGKTGRKEEGGGWKEEGGATRQWPSAVDDGWHLNDASLSSMTQSPAAIQSKTGVGEGGRGTGGRVPSIHFPSSAIHFCNLAILVGFEPIRRMKGGRRMRLLIQWARRRGAGGTGGGEGGGGEGSGKQPEGNVKINPL